MSITSISFAQQPTNIYQPGSSFLAIGQATNDNSNYYVNLRFSPFSVMKIDGNGTITQVCDLPSAAQSIMFNNGKGIYKTTSGYTLFDGTNHTAIPPTLIPAAYPFNVINFDFFHIGAVTYFQNQKSIFKTDYSSVATIQTLYTSNATVSDPTNYFIKTMYNTGNSIYFVEAGSTNVSGSTNNLKRIDISTGLVTTVDIISSSAFGSPMTVYNNCLYYSKGSFTNAPFGEAKKVDDNGIVTSLYAGTNTSDTIMFLLGVTPNGVIVTTSQKELVLLTNNTFNALNHNITSSPLPYISNTMIGKSTDNLVYFEALDSYKTTGPAENAVWVTDGTLVGTKKIIAKNDYKVSFMSNENNSILTKSTTASCGDNLYFIAQKDASSINLYNINGTTGTYSIYTPLASPDLLFKNPQGGVYFNASTTSSSFLKAVFKADCSTGLSVVDINLLSNNFKIFPNPSNGNFNIEIDQDLIGFKATVYNLLGQKIKDFDLKATTTNQTLNKGIYLLEIEKDGNKTSKKLIVN